MKPDCEGNAIIYCEGAFGPTNGKTAHGLLRRSERFKILSVVDSQYKDDGLDNPLTRFTESVPVLNSVEEAIDVASAIGLPATHLIIGLTPDGGKLPSFARREIFLAVSWGLSIISGLHDFLSEDGQLVSLADKLDLELIDLRKPPHRNNLNFFEGKIEDVEALRIAVLGTDSAVGKRTTAWLMVDRLRELGKVTEIVGTGQTARLQGAKYGIVLDSLVNDFVSGEIEHAVWSAWKKGKAEAIIIEGQGSLMNPAYPSGLEILAAGRPDCIVLQHAPGRRDYDGFPGYAIHPIKRQIEAIEVLSDKPVVAITVNSESLAKEDIPDVCKKLEVETGLPTVEPLTQGIGPVVDAVLAHGNEEMNRGTVSK